MCRNCVDKNSNLLDLLKKVDSVRERFNVVAVNLIEKNHTTVTKKQRDGDCDQREDVARVQNPVNPVFSTNEFVTISKRDQETQTKPETSENILESTVHAFSVTVLKFIFSPCTHTQCHVCRLCIFTWVFCSTKFYLQYLLCLLQ